MARGRAQRARVRAACPPSTLCGARSAEPGQRAHQGDLEAWLVYEQNLINEMASLTTINRELPHSRHFPVLGEHGRLADGRVYLTMSLFDEWPLATAVGSERRPDRLVTHLRTTVEVAKALGELHGLEIWHVDLNPMNILSRWEAGKPVIRLVDFESSYEVSRYSTGRFYNPPTTS